MKNHHIIEQTVKHKQKKQMAKGKSGALVWWQLSLIGIGSIIGAGFFLGTGLSIQLAGPAILINYFIAGVTVFFVFAALAEMTVNDPVKGSFRIYAKKAYGHSAGFVSGWMYWLSGVLIMSSEIIALSTFTQYWFPAIPLWIFSIIYTAIGFGINLLGVRNFGKIESIFAVVKLTTLLAFVLFGFLLLFHIITPADITASGTHLSQKFMPNGLKGLWSALIFVFFSFGGIAVIGVASTELKSKKDVPKAGIGMLVTLVSVYILSLSFVLWMVPWNKINESESPFVTALSSFQIPYLDSIFNIIIISAAFSTMVGALYSITNVLVSLARDEDAPSSMANKNSRGVALKSLGLTAIALAVSISLSFFLPDTVYEYITTSAGVLLIMNWAIILSSQLKLRPNYKDESAGRFKMPGYPFTSYAGLFMIALTIIGALLSGGQRIGVFISLGLILLIIVIYKLVQHRLHPRG